MMNESISPNETKHIPATVNIVLQTYFKMVDEKLPNLLESFYLFGSVSIVAYQEGLSDIDFYAVVKRKLTKADLEVLKQIHQDMKGQFPKPGLDGMYVMRDDLEGHNEGESSCPYFNEGNLQGFRPFHRNWIDAYQLKKYGIVVKGLPVESYNYPVDWNLLKTNLVENINGYWLNWVNRCKRVTSLQYLGLFVSPSMIEWGVLGVTRLYYSLREEDITSKMGAGEYALKTVPEEYHLIIREALRIRNGNTFSLYSSIFKRRRDTLKYMKFMIKACNE
ncbi:aminoglycoside adenylyltransferase domain-containing protein [Fictibacillus barbaricus]|uniref:Adenylyltransferase AadA C-terminal domain-containing protein n=1 Tax=Fictibacillus barbaricus TaxID=182136 RepID=A0ABU1TWW5_9BACL|nr:aminoglycoside adenylyltransferase domain-containing protein [Fictibacillus barbaricus]MDR7071682.1 hypothetical protein [Fictibacillus barbaricus]